MVVGSSEGQLMASSLLEFQPVLSRQSSGFKLQGKTMLDSGGKVEDLNSFEQIFFTNGRSNMLRKPNIFSLETIVEEGLAHPELDDEELLELFVAFDNVGIQTC